MTTIAEYIASGILELYVMGATTPEETAEVEQLMATHAEVRREIDTISESLEAYAMAHAVKPHATAKPLMLATINYMGRLQAGEAPANPKLLSEASTVADYSEWLNRPDMQDPTEVEEMVVKLIAATPEVTTALVWIKDKADYEVHDKEYERFLIIAGTCDITAGDEVYHFGPGDFYSVPLHTPHQVQVTSAVPCKVIVQRVAVAA